jgi:hypothetical protein
MCYCRVTGGATDGAVAVVRAATNFATSIRRRCYKGRLRCVDVFFSGGARRSGTSNGFSIDWRLATASPSIGDGRGSRWRRGPSCGRGTIGNGVGFFLRVYQCLSGPVWMEVDTCWMEEAGDRDPLGTLSASHIGSLI